MTDVQFGVIFDVEYLNEEKTKLKLTYNNVFFATNEIIRTGKFKNNKIKNLKMMEIVMDQENQVALIDFDKNKYNKAFISFDKNQKQFDNELNAFVNFCYTMTINDLIGDLNNQSLTFSKNSRENDKKLKSKIETEILKEYAELERFLFPEFATDGELGVLEIIDLLKEKIKGQDKAIETLVSNVILNKKLLEIDDRDLIKHSKSNILLEGPTGVGKTLLVTELAKVLNMPCVVKSATNYSGVGYVGDDLNSILSDLIRVSQGDIQAAMNGIICLDEIDKLGDSTLEIRKGVMQELLTWLSGTTLKVKYNNKSYVFNTENLTFIFLGAFSKMRDTKKESSIGFMKTETEEKFSTKDYTEFGMERELMGRINVVASLNQLGKEEFKDILFNSSISPLLQLIEIGRLYDVEITYSDELIDEVINRAIKSEIGARGITREINTLRSKILIPIEDGQIKEIELVPEMLDDDYTYRNVLKRTLTLGS